MKTAIVRSRSLYSSMSRLTNFGVVAVAASVNRGVSCSTMSSTASGNAHGLCGGTVAETFTVSTPVTSSSPITFNGGYVRFPQAATGFGSHVINTTTFNGGIMYNKKVYEKLGLKIPTTWDEFIANSEKIKAAGIAPIIQTYQDTWTSQLFVLGDFHNVSAAEPNWADDYTKNKVHYADDPVALAGFEHLQQAHDEGLVNSDFASLTNAQGLQMLADGKGAQYPMLSGVLTGLLATNPDAAQTVGFFALPGSDAGS